MTPGFCKKKEVTGVPLGRPSWYAYHRLGTPALWQITFAHNFPLRTDFPTAASLRIVVRCFVNLDQLDDLTQNDSIKRLALPNIVCEVNSVSHNVSEYYMPC